MKRKSKQKKIIAFSLMLVLMTTTLLGLLPLQTLQAAENNFSVEGLNNKGTPEAGKVKKKVTGDYPGNATACTNLDVILTDPNDTVTMYKIADTKWNATSGVYDDSVWVDVVDAWIKANDTYKDDANYASPKALSSASTTTWTAFYKALLKEGTNVIEHSVTVDAAEKTLEKYNDSPQGSNKTDDVNHTYIARFENVPFGTYAIMGTSAAGGTFNPVVINLVPEKNGPTGSYYINEEYSIALKDAEAGIEKFINETEADTVSIGETVDFRVDFNLPTLPKDRVTLTGSTGNDIREFTLRFEDVMSPAFEMVADSLVIEYNCTVQGSTVDVTADLANIPEVTYYVLTDESYQAKTGETKTLITAGNIDSLGLDCSEEAKAALYGATPYYYIERTAPIYTINEGTYNQTNGTTIEMNMNVGALKAYLAQATEENTIPSKINQISISYKAVVTDQIVVNSEENKNTATVYYEKNALGTNVGNVSAVVRAYTYGLQVVKVDGSTEGTDAPKYLSGAEFSLFQETSTYIDGEWKGDMQGSLTPPAKTLEEIKADTTNYYVLETEETGTEVQYTDAFLVQERDATPEELAVTPEATRVKYTDDTKVSYQSDGTTPVTVTRVFERYTGVLSDNVEDYSYSDANKIVSVNTEAGITLGGLNTGNYMLVETKAPLTYNDLAEDIYFSIKGLTKEEAQANNRGSMAGFKELDDTYNATGVLSLRVLNYKGLTLPSTGGIGTLIFIIIGIVVMISAVVVIIVRNRRNRD